LLAITDKNLNTVQKIFLQGGGDHGKVVLDCLQETGQQVVGIFDPRLSGILFGVAQMGKYDPTFDSLAKCIITIGDNALRKKVAQATAHGFANAIHHSALISSKAVYGIGNMILHRTIIQANAVIGNHVIINTGAQVDHDCRINDFVHIAPGSVLCGTVSVGEGAFIGAGAIVLPGKKIGDWAVIGAGTVVIDDVPDGCTVVGNPGRILTRQLK
jgi:sugar O-acyltransferase (sialic acid O-acetyltransferase NeuD family)